MAMAKGSQKTIMRVAGMVANELQPPLLYWSSASNSCRTTKKIPKFLADMYLLASNSCLPGSSIALCLGSIEAGPRPMKPLGL